MKAQEVLEQLRKTPRMYASNKEAYCAQVLTALWMDDIKFEVPGHGSAGGNFYAKHIGRYGSSIVGSNDPFDDAWAHAVIDDALSFVRSHTMTITSPETNFPRDSHCGYCGARFTEQKVWPRKCFICWNDSYKNPIPIVVALMPVFTRPTSQCGWLVEKRGIEPQKGGWALPSGYIDFGETWQQAIVREMQEEVGLDTKEEDWNLFEIVNSTNGNMLLFCTHRGVKAEEIKFSPNEEVEAISFPVLPQHQELCFPSHNEMWLKYYNLLD